jgi:hypothetical protein
MDGDKIASMRLRIKLVLAGILVASLVSVNARAMTLENFGRMDDDDEATYVTLLVEASTQMLKAEGRPDQAAKALAFFKEPGRDGGVQQFAAHLEAINGQNMRNQTNPNNRVPDLQVEDAMQKTLQAQGITVPAKYLLAAGKDFHPEGPPRQHILGN